MKLNILLIVLFIVQATHGQIPNKYICNKMNSAINIDGNLDESSWKIAEWSNDFVDILGEGVEKPKFKTKIKMLWDDNYLYIAAVLEEKDIWATLKNRDDIIYRDNDFEVFIDQDGDGKKYYEVEVNALNTIMDLFMNKPYHLGGRSDLTMDIEDMKTAVKINGTLNNPVDIDTSWVVEMAIPFYKIYENRENKVKPGINDFWRINFSRVEWDTKLEQGKYVKLDKPEYNWVWSPQYIIDMHRPEKWGYVYFIDKTRAKQDKSFWIWLNLKDDFSDDNIDKALAKIYGTGIRNIMVNTSTDKLKKVVAQAKKYDINVYAWFITMNRRDLANKHPDWLSVNRENKSLKEKKAYVNYYKFLCPAIPEVRNALKKKIEELCRIPGLKGIHLDYIRYVDAILPVGLWSKYDIVQDKVYPQFDYGYHPYMRQKYKNKTGVDPLHTMNPTLDSSWSQFRLNQVTEFIFQIDSLTQAYDKLLTAAVFPTPEMSREMVYQDWGKWPLDLAFPMLYHNFYNEDIDWIGQMVNEDVKTSFPSTKIIAGIFAPDLKNPGEITKAVKVSLQNGASGVSIFGLNPLEDDSRWEELKMVIISN